MRIHPEVAQARARKAALSRCIKNGERPPGDPAAEDATRDLAAAKIRSYVERVLETAPPLTDEQRTRLAELLRPGGA